MNNDRFPWRRYVWRRVGRLPLCRRTPVPVDRLGPVAGFTLIELTVGVALLGLIAVMMLGGLRFGTRVWQTGADIGERRSEVMAVQSLLRRQLMQAAVDVTPANRAKSGGLFDGSRGAIHFVAPFPQRSGEGSLFMHTLYLSGQGNDKELRLSWRPFDRATGITAAPDVAENDETVLLDNVIEVRFEYFDPGEEGRIWQDDWQEERVPALVRIRVDFNVDDNGYWPPMTIATNQGVWREAGACPNSLVSFTLGGTGETGGTGRANPKCGRQILSLDLR